MEINLTKVLESENERIPFTINESIENNIIEFSGERIVLLRPLKISGTLINSEDKIHISMNLETQIERVCSRCINPYNEKLSIDVNTTVSEDIENGEDGVRFLNSYTIDITEMIIEEITSQLSMKPLCNNDCKGLCSICGINKNTDNCTCEEKNIDPRLQKLSEFFDQE